MSWVIRAYQPSDLAGCLALVRSNTPMYFDPAEVAEFKDDLQHWAKLPDAKKWPYFVLETCGTIRACGGYFLSNSETATLIWGMVGFNEHRKGLGKHLLNYRLTTLPTSVKYVELDTTPASFGFYQKFGFEQHGFEADGYGPGLDKVLARLTRYLV